MTYVNALKFLASLPDGDANIERAHKIRELLSYTDDSPKTIHILGKQGKNSSHRMLTSILAESGLKVGGYSPSHAIEPREAITVNGRLVAYDIFADTINKLKNIYSENPLLGVPSRDELLCLAAMLIFKKENCDVAIFEKGLKKTDAVNMTDAPILSVISSMGDLSPDEFDLSDSLRRGTTETVTSPQHKNTYNAISEACARIGSRLTLAIYSELEITRINLFKTVFAYEGAEYSIRSFSPYQTVNAITVIEASNALVRLGIPIKSVDIVNGIGKATFPYKCEALTLEPTIIVSSADNEERIGALAASIAQVSELITGNIFVAIDNGLSVNEERIRSIFSTYGVEADQIVTISSELTPAKLKKRLTELASPIVSDESMSSALILIARKELIVKISEAIRQILGRT